MNYPYSDEYMIFDEEESRYILTEKYAFDKLGLNLAERVNERNSVNQQIAVKGILNRISSQIYNFIHKHCFDDAARDLIIHCVPSARKVIMQAMSDQLYYEAIKGDLSTSVDPQKRVLSIDENAKITLQRIIPEVGFNLLYTGL